MEKKSSSLWNWFKGFQPDNQPVEDRYSASIQMEKQIGEQIYNALQGSVVEEVLRKAKASNNDTYWRSTMEGHSLKVEKDLLPDFYELCHQVKSKLHFEDPVDFWKSPVCVTPEAQVPLTLESKFRMTPIKS